MFDAGRTLFNIVIKLNLGIYVFDDYEAATGKTRLYNELRDDSSLFGKVLAVNFADVCSRGVDVNKLVKNGNYELIVLDRYDRMPGIDKEVLINASKHSIILIDCKDTGDWVYGTDFCWIEMHKNGIEVYQ